MRAFFAILVPERVGRSLLGLVPPVKGVRRGRAEGLHLTLHFLADAPDDLPERLGLPRLPRRFGLRPGRVILLPPSGPVRVIAASADGGEGLLTLHEAVGEALQKLGLPVAPRPLLPHITLARCEPPLPQQVRGQTPMAPREDLAFDVGEVALVESARSDGRLEHRVRRTWTLPG